MSDIDVSIDKKIDGCTITKYNSDYLRVDFKNQYRIFVYESYNQDVYLEEVLYNIAKMKVTPSSVLFYKTSVYNSRTNYFSIKLKNANRLVLDLKEDKTLELRIY